MLLKRKLALLGLLLLGALLCAAATAQTFLQRESAEPIIPAVEKKYTSYETAAYILKEHNGYVTVFDSRTGRLLETTGISVKALRSGDRALLDAGITADSQESLLRLLEDFNS